MQLLHLDSSALGEYSVSRQLTAAIVAAQKSAHPDLQVRYYDLAAEPIAHLTGAELGVYRGAEATDPALQQLAAQNEQVMADFLAADLIVIGAPMYNFSIPSQLKAWIDRILVAGKTFRYTATGPESLIDNKPVIIASTRGGFHGAESPTAMLDHQERYLTTALNFIGLTNLHFIRAEGLGMPDKRDASVRAALLEIQQLILP